MATDSEQFIVSSATGVDVLLDVAGPGSRSYAFIVDWCLRTLVAGAWFLCASLATLGHVFPEGKGATTSEPYVLFVIVPALGIFMLYHPILEIAMRGRTPGKRTAGVRLVTASGATPSTAAILIRNLFRLIDCLPAFYLVGLITTLATAQRVRIGDLAAGTILVEERASDLSALSALGSLAGQSTLDPAAFEIARDLLARWRTLEPASRDSVARALLERIDRSQDARQLAALGSDSLRALIEAALRGGTAA